MREEGQVEERLVDECVWLVGEKERRNRERRKAMGAFREELKKRVGKGKMRCPQ